MPWGAKKFKNLVKEHVNIDCSMTLIYCALMFIRLSSSRYVCSRYQLMYIFALLLLFAQPILVLIVNFKVNDFLFLCGSTFHFSILTISVTSTTFQTLSASWDERQSKAEPATGKCFLQRSQTLQWMRQRAHKNCLQNKASNDVIKNRRQIRASYYVLVNCVHALCT